MANHKTVRFSDKCQSIKYRRGQGGIFLGGHFISEIAPNRRGTAEGVIPPREVQGWGRVWFKVFWESKEPAGAEGHEQLLRYYLCTDMRQRNDLDPSKSGAGSWGG